MQQILKFEISRREHAQKASAEQKVNDVTDSARERKQKKIEKRG